MECQQLVQYQNREGGTYYLYKWWLRVWMLAIGLFASNQHRFSLCSWGLTGCLTSGLPDIGAAGCYLPTIT